MAVRSSSTAERSRPCNVGTSTIATPPDHGSRKHSAKLTQILDLLAEDSWLNVYAGKLDVRPPGDHSETDCFAASTRPTNACSRGDEFPFFQITLNGSRTSISTTGSSAMPLGHCHRVDSVTQAIPIWHWTRPRTVSRSVAS